MQIEAKEKISLSVLSHILNCVKDYCDKHHYTDVNIICLDDYSHDYDGRYDIYINALNNTGNLITQKLFVIDDEAIDCATYREKYLL